MRRDGTGTREPILIVTPFYDGAGGVAVAARSLAGAFRAKGHPVRLLARGTTATVAPDDTEDGTYRVKLRMPYGSTRSWVAFLLISPITMLSLWVFLVRHRIRIVSVQYGAPWQFYFGVLRWFAAWKLFVTFQGSDAHSIGAGPFRDRVFYNILLRSADGVSAVAETLMRQVRAAVPRASAHTAIIPNGAPPASGLADSQEDYAITVGLLIHRKGIDVLLRALAILQTRGIRQRLVVVGSGPEHAALLTLAKELAVDGAVEFVGEKAHADALSLIRRCRFFVLASRAEGLPLVVVEAMMSGRPVVATNVDGTPAIVKHDLTGLLVDPDNETQLADAMQRVIEDEALRQRLGEAARRSAVDFEWPRVAARYLDHFGAASSEL
jgi:glycosyltransferase involved in cell wall biosynthesis